MMSFCVNAQVYVGGSISMNSTGGKYDDGSKKPSNLSISLNPDFGKFLSDKLAAGIMLHLGNSRNNNQNEVEVVNKTSSFGIFPYVRYYSTLAGKLSLFTQAYAGLGLENRKTVTGGNTTDGPSATSISIGIYPGLSYDVNDRLSLETSVNLFNIGVSSTTEKTGSNKETNTHFGIGAGLDNLVNTSNISVGAILKF